MLKFIGLISAGDTNVSKHMWLLGPAVCYWQKYDIAYVMYMYGTDEQADRAYMHLNWRCRYGSGHSGAIIYLLYKLTLVISF